MTLTPDETRLLDLYRKAKRRRLTLHVVCHEAAAKMYLTKQEEAVTCSIAPPSVYDGDGRSTLAFITDL